MRRINGLLVTLIIAIALAACGGAEDVEPTEVEPLPIGDAERGREIFQNGGVHENYEEQYYCSRCHSLDGIDGDGPTLQGITEAAGDRVPELSAEEYIRQSILDPNAYIIEGYNHQMGSIHRVLLSEDEVDDLVAFLLTQ